jgi:DNA polymerase-3 subunit alpha
MKYFCNSKLEYLKNLENFIGKTLTFAGIVTNVQYRTAKNGKDWAMFTIEGYDENHEFRIFDEEYLKYRHFLINNQFIYFKVTIKEGWVNRETGKKSDPRIQFVDVKQLQDVLPQFAKKLSIQLDINGLHKNVIEQLNTIFQSSKGDKTVSFEVVEYDKSPKIAEIISKDIVETDENIDLENLENGDAEIPMIELENLVITKVLLPSRKLKIQISNDLLFELEKMNIKFSLN